MSWSNVTSRLRDLSGLDVAISRSSSPLARARKWPVRLPSTSLSTAGSALRSCPIVKIPSFRIFGNVCLPIPQILLTGIGSRNERTPVRDTCTKPLGLPASDASFARYLLCAIPTEACSPVRFSIFARKFAPIVSILPSSARLADTSRNASSSDKPSTSGVASRNILKTSAETSL